MEMEEAMKTGEKVSIGEIVEFMGGHDKEPITSVSPKGFTVNDGVVYSWNCLHDIGADGSRRLIVNLEM